MDNEKRKRELKAEEQAAFSGWGFSHLNGRWKVGAVPWDYHRIVTDRLTDDVNLLDMGTGGGEFLLSLNHPYRLTSVTEGYLPNYELCLKNLAPLGITARRVAEDDRLPFSDEIFDLVINRHESFDPNEVYRVLKPGGLFITQQVGGQNVLDLAKRLDGSAVSQFFNHDLAHNLAAVKKAGFVVFESGEAFPTMEFYDVSAVVYFAKIIVWSFPDFSVETSFDALLELQKEVEESGKIETREHRFYLIARK